MSEEETKGKDYMVLHTLKNWLVAICMQGERVLENSKQMEKFDQSQSYQLARIMRSPDEHFFLIATNKCLEYVAQAVNRKLVDKKSFIPLWAVTSKVVKKVRDMREHDVEYVVKGVGKKQSDFVQYLSEYSAAIDASSTIVIDGKYLIGGLVSLVDTMEAAKALIPILDVEINNFNRRRSAIA